MGKYTIETLKKMNPVFDFKYRITDADVTMINRLIKKIESQILTHVVHMGDSVQYTDEYGCYYPDGTVANMFGEMQICEHASIYVGEDQHGKIYQNVSGGAFNKCKINDFKYIGTVKKTFWTFGHCGACESGGIYFEALVNQWEYDIHETEFTTKTHDKYYLSYRETDDKSEYQYFASKNGYNSGAWKTESEFQAWLRTHRAVISKEYRTVAWTYKEIEHHCSNVEYEALNAPEDIMLMNGSKRRCKRIYDDDKCILHTYFVWYWEDDTMEWEDRYTMQNKIIDSYEVDYFKNEVNSLAMEELRNGKIEPLKIIFE